MSIPASKFTAVFVDLVNIIYSVPLYFLTLHRTFLGYFVAAHIMLLSFMLDNPTDLENTSRVLAMETFVKSLQDITEENGFDLKQIIASCAEMLAIAQSTTETSAASSSSRRHEVSGAMQYTQKPYLFYICLSCGSR